jgi:hypothetical protein
MKPPTSADKGAVGEAAAVALLTGLSNQEFLEKFARPGLIGLSGGVTLIDKAICRAQRHLDDEE